MDTELKGGVGWRGEMLLLYSPSAGDVQPLPGKQDLRACSGGFERQTP